MRMAGMADDSGHTAMRVRRIRALPKEREKLVVRAIRPDGFLVACATGLSSAQVGMKVDSVVSTASCPSQESDHRMIDPVMQQLNPT